MLSPLPLFIQLISLEMTLDIATLLGSSRTHQTSRIADIFAVVFVVVYSSSGGYSTQLIKTRYLMDLKERKLNVSKFKAVSRVSVHF